MAKITRVFQKIFASTAPTTDIGEFGSFAAGTPVTTNDPVVIQSLSNFLAGWKAAIVGNNSPAIEDMNALFFLLYRQLAYVFQAGISEWETNTVYYIGSLAQVSGTIYVSLTDNNTGNAVTDPVNWSVLEGRVATKTANYTATAADDVLLVDPASGDRTLTLPAAAGAKGKKILIKNIDAGSGNVVNIARTGADLIDGETSQVLSTPMTGIIYISDGVSNWYSF